MNKRLTYLLTALLMAQTSSPISAHPVEINTPGRVVTTRSIQTTTDSSIGVNKPTTGPSIGMDQPTTGPSIGVEQPTTSAGIKCVTVTADSITSGDSLNISDFSKDYVSIKVQLQGTALKDPKHDVTSVAYGIETSLNLDPSEDKYDQQKLNSLYINHETEIIINLKTAHIDLNSIGHALTFTISHSLLTTDKDVTVTVPITYDMPLPDSSVLVTSNPILASDIAGGRFTVSAQLLNTAFINPKLSAGSVHSYILNSLNLTTLDNTELNEHSNVAIINETEFVFSMAATNIDPKNIPNILTFKIPGSLLTGGKSVMVHVPVIHDQIAKPTISLPEGKYYGTQYVTLDCATPDVQIRYTLDGSEVTLNSPLYTAGQTIAITNSSTLKAAAYKGTMPSETTLAQYTIIRPVSNATTSSSSGSTSKPSLDKPLDSTAKNNALAKPSTVASDSEVSNLPVSSDEIVEVNDTVKINDLVEVNDSVILSNSAQSIIKSQQRNLNSKVHIASYGLSINNKKLDLQDNLLISNGRTLVPIRTLSQALNLPIQYHQATKTAVIRTADMTLEFPIGYNVAIVNGEIVPLDSNNANVISTLQNNRAYLPIAFIAEKLNLNLSIHNNDIHLTSK